MTLRRQGSRYLAIGGVQWLVDWGVMVALSRFGLIVEAANVCGRISGALLGFWLNGKLTFVAYDTAIGRAQLRRFATMWLGMTAVSTGAMSYIDDIAGLEWTWLAKPVVELTLGIVSFLLSRHWVYKA